MRNFDIWGFSCPAQSSLMHVFGYLYFEGFRKTIEEDDISVNTMVGRWHTINIFPLGFSYGLELKQKLNIMLFIVVEVYFR